MPPTDPYGRAIRDHAHGRLTEPLYERDGDDVREHPIEAYYFGTFDGTHADGG